MNCLFVFVVVVFVSLSVGQQMGTLTTERHPPVNVQTCTRKECESKRAYFVLDANWRWIHEAGKHAACFDPASNSWSPTLCPDAVTCSQQCALDGVEYAEEYGFTTNHDSVRMKKDIRVFMLENQENYRKFLMKNREISFDLDLSQLPCGKSAEMILLPMEGDGGKEKYELNDAGARFGTGYCDAQCSHDNKFIEGEANSVGYTANHQYLSYGKFGSCCPEVDLFVGNSQMHSSRVHSCDLPGPRKCSGTKCDKKKGMCDQEGCDLNSYRNGNRSFYGEGDEFMINTNRPFTLVVQFLTDNGHESGELESIRFLYIQNGQMFELPKSRFSGMRGYNSLSDHYCAAQKHTFGEDNDFGKHEGFSVLSKSLDLGMVLALRLTDSYLPTIPKGTDVNYPGVMKGPCKASKNQPSVDPSSIYVTISNIKFGEMHSTYDINGLTVDLWSANY